MKDRKGSIKWILLLAVLVILILLLTMCTKDSGGGPEETLPVLATESSAPMQTVAVTEQTEEATEPTATAAPTEETTEETTEPTTEPTEEATEATSAPSSSSSGSNSNEAEEDFGEEEPYWEGPDPGTPENPYMEVRTEYPAKVESVKIPKNTGVSYVIAGSAGSVITIQDPDVTLTLDGKTYTADKATGELTVDMSKLGADPVITLAHSGSTAAACVLNLAEGLGGMGNPETLADPAELVVQLPQGDTNGYHYRWISDTTGQVELKLKEKEPVSEETTEATEEQTEETPGTEETLPPEEPVLDIIVTIGEQVIKLSECEDGKLVLDTVKDQEIQIQVIALPFTDGTYPAVEETVLWTRYPSPGTKENPESIDSIETVAVTLEAGNAYGHYYQWTATTYGDVTLKADNLLLIATVDETSYESTDGEVSFHINKDQQLLLQATAVPVAEEGTDAKVYPAASDTITGTMAPDAGTPENPEERASIETVEVALQEGDRDGHTIQWTVQYGGTLELNAETTAANIDVILTNTASGLSQKRSESEAGTLILELEAADVVTIQTIAVPDESGQYGAANVALKGVFTPEPGSNPENPIVIEQTESAATFAMGEKQTLYFSGMVHEMIATVENAYGASIRCGEETVWAGQSGVAEMEFPAAQAEEPVTFSITSKNEKEMTMTFAYPAGHEKNPADLVLGETKVTLEENDEDGYLLDWTASCDGQLTIAVEGKTGWQYQLDDLTAGISGQRFTSDQEPAAASQTIEVKAGTKIRLTLWTQAAEEQPLPSGTLKVTASFYDPLLGTEAKPISLNIGEDTVNTVTIPAGETLYYVANAEGMLLHFTGRDVKLTHNGTEYVPENGMLELLCHGSESVFAITANAETEQACALRFTYPVGHRENPADLVLGENTAQLEDGSLCGYTFAWTAESNGILTVTMAEGSWQYLISNETTGMTGVIHTSEDQPLPASENVEVSKGDRLLVTVNTFDLEHPLNAPAGSVVFTAEFVDPTLGMEENPVWLNLEDTLVIPAGKTMYCAAKADGMILALKGINVTVTHNGTDYSAQQGTVTVQCAGTETFGHPVFAVTNTGAYEGTYTVSFAYPEGHFMNPEALKLEEMKVVPGKNGCHFLWTAESDGLFTFTMNSESGWKYRIANVTTEKLGELRTAEDKELVSSETVEVKAGDQLRIAVNTLEEDGSEVTFTAAFTPAQPVESDI